MIYKLVRTNFPRFWKLSAPHSTSPVSPRPRPKVTSPDQRAPQAATAGREKWGRPRRRKPLFGKCRRTYGDYERGAELAQDVPEHGAAGHGAIAWVPPPRERRKPLAVLRVRV
ncbi:hypothetical protein M758_5G014900 [Ceratodon purpureus]|nr:hypothetical protein M758_5G014900 [Ceratodon purpureus]